MSARRTGQAVAALALAWSGAALAAGAPIYTCVDAHGKKLTSDRPIAECSTREQRVLNPDGSVKNIVPPALTADERAEQEAREQQAAAERAAQREAVRRDRNLMARYPNEALHQKARAAALDTPQAALQRSERRLAELALERKPLVDESEFYTGKPLPAKLKQQLDANDSSVEAQRVLIQNHQAEIARVNASFDLELARLKRLWAGAVPGSLGPLSGASAASAPLASAAAASAAAPTARKSAAK